MIIRSERAADQAAIHAVHAASFPTTAEARLVDALRAARRLRISLVAVEGDAIIGHIAFSPVHVAHTTDGLGLAPLAVIPAEQRRGVGAELVRAGLVACEHVDCAFVVVLGDPRYYGRFGFTPASTFDLRDEYGGGAAFQAMELRVNAIPTAGGTVRYAPEFALVEGEAGS